MRENTDDRLDASTRRGLLRGAAGIAGGLFLSGPAATSVRGSPSANTPAASSAASAGPTYGDPVTLPEDEQAQTGQSNESGVRFTATADMVGLEVTLSSEVDGLTAAFLKAGAGGEPVDEVDLSNRGAGDTVTFEYDVRAGRTYEVTADAGGGEYVRGRSSADYPYAGDELEVTAGVYTGGGSDTSNYRYNVSELRPILGSRDDREAPEYLPDDAHVVWVDEEPSIDADGDLSAEIASYLEARTTVNHAFVVPGGSYDWGQPLTVGDADYFGLVGADPDDRPVFGITRSMNALLTLGVGGVPDEVDCRDFVGDLDAHPADAGETNDAGFIVGTIGSRGRFEDLELVGKRQRWYHEGQESGRGNRFAFRIHVADTSGEALVRRLRMLDGELDTAAGPDENQEYSIGVAVDPGNNGTVIYEDCHIANWIDNGYYFYRDRDQADNGTIGDAYIYDSRSENCSGCDLRLGENDEAHGCEIVLDDMAGRIPGTALWLHDAGASVEDVTIHATETNFHLVRFNSKTDAATIDGLDLYVGPNHEHEVFKCTERSYTDHGDIVVENFDVEVHGTGGTDAVDIDRDLVTFRNGSFEFHGSSYTGVSIGDDGTTLENVDITATNGGDAIGIDSGNVELTGTTVDGHGDGAPAGLRLEDGFDPDTTTAAGNAFSNVELRNDTGHDVSLEDFEEGTFGGGAGDGWIDLGTDDAADSTTNENGIHFHAEEDLAGIRLRLSGNSAGVRTCRLYDASSTSVVAERDVSSLEAGDAFTVAPDGGLEADSYYVTLDADGSWTRGRFESPSYPYGNDTLTVKHGVYTGGGSTTEDVRYAFSEVAPILES
ncbi:hypothetical protein [Halopiger djelfimassiliensis]|uniref:hypothetical protein n=1 Tax=Halopiger djelfimassiliensis TaxID=1293047 RepID=UPI000677A28D|nr:hypothetical protein [Halopiger djelfimassiliensis]